MSERDYNNEPLADAIFGGNPSILEVGYNSPSPASEPVVLFPEYAPTSQPQNGGEPKLYATVAGHADKPIYEYPDGRKVVRVPRHAAGNAPINAAETPRPAAESPLNSLSLNLSQGPDGISGDFRLKGQFMDLLGGLAGTATNNSRSNAPARQLERGIAIQPSPQRLVAPATQRPYEVSKTESDDDWSGSETATIATHGLKKVIQAVLRPRLAGAVLALSVAAAGGAYRLESGVLPIHGNPIEVIQADINQVSHHPLETIVAQIGKL